MCCRTRGSRSPIQHNGRHHETDIRPPITLPPPPDDPVRPARRRARRAAPGRTGGEASKWNAPGTSTTADALNAVANGLPHENNQMLAVRIALRCPQNLNTPPLDVVMDQVFDETTHLRSSIVNTSSGKRRPEYNNALALGANTEYAGPKVRDLRATVPSTPHVTVHPTPFVSSATIRYTLPRASNVRISIYSSLGTRIATLIDAWQPAGAHIAVFADLPSGIYIYRLSAESSVETGKLHLNK
jgi:hypothetical protein